MNKPFTTICLAIAALLAVGAYLSAQGGKQPSAEPAAQLTLAMQEPAATAPEKPSAPLANMGWIGVMLQDTGGAGARVVSVFPGGPAAAAGVRAGDVLVRIGGTEIASPQDAEKAIEHLTPRKEAPITVERHSKKIELKVHTESLADFKRDYTAEMLRRDPRNPNFAVHHGISDADVSAEVVRRLFEQHERMERTLNEVVKELQALRQEVATLKQNR